MILWHRKFDDVCNFYITQQKYYCMFTFPILKDFLLAFPYLYVETVSTMKNQKCLLQEDIKTKKTIILFYPKRNES